MRINNKILTLKPRSRTHGTLISQPLTSSFLDAYAAVYSSFRSSLFIERSDLEGML